MKRDRFRTSSMWLKMRGTASDCTDRRLHPIDVRGRLASFDIVVGIVEKRDLSNCTNAESLADIQSIHKHTRSAE